MRASTLAVLVGTVGSSLACTGGTPDDAPVAPAAAPGAPAEVAPPVAAAAPVAGGPVAGAVYSLTGLENGDAACYVDVIDPSGTQQNFPGDFELCAGASHDATGLIGKSVVLTTEKGSVLSASCQGDPACTQTDTVDLVTGIRAP